MKKLITLIVLIIAALQLTMVNAQTAKECSVYTPVKTVLRAKGQEGFRYVVPEETTLLPRQVVKTREIKPKDVCSFSFYNYNSQPIHVFIDSVYSGTIEANRVGVINEIKTSANFYCITADEDYSWEDVADCECRLIFHLRIKRFEGDVKFD